MIKFEIRHCIFIGVDDSNNDEKYMEIKNEGQSRAYVIYLFVILSLIIFV